MRFFQIFALLMWMPLFLACTSQSAPQPYTEPHRPQFHFSPPSMWMNDPNGMVFFKGEYHLFYQHYPKDKVWGPMHWGHAVSRDFVHWEHLPIALYPDSLGYIFSGSAVVDWNNSSGLGQGGEPPLVAIFTHHDPAGEKAGRVDFQYQSIAYSHDRGRTWHKYAGNPVLPNPGIRDFRDPKVFWDEGSRRWVLVLAAKDRVHFYGSADLKNWTFLSEFGAGVGAHGGVWECPDLFPLPLTETGEKRWVLLVSLNPGGPNGGSATQYFVGQFDGKNFLPDSAFLEQLEREGAAWLDFGRDNYAGVTWSDLPPEDGRRIFIGWMSNWDYAQAVPTDPWRSAMTLPRTLSLHHHGNDLRLHSRPVRELETLRGRSFLLQEAALPDTLDLTDRLGFSPAQMEAQLEFELEAGFFALEWSNAAGDSYRLGYDARRRRFFSDRRQAGAIDFSPKFAAEVHEAPRYAEGPLRLHLFADVAGVELFADDGATVLTEIFFPKEAFSRLRLLTSGGPTRRFKGRFFELKGIW